MTGRTFLGLLLLMIVSVPLSRLVASPRWNPLPICIVMPVLAVVAFHDRRQPVRWWVTACFIVTGAFSGFALAIGMLVLDFSHVFPTSGFEFGGTYYGWDNI